MTPAAIAKAIAALETAPIYPKVNIGAYNRWYKQERASALADLKQWAERQDKPVLAEMVAAITEDNRHTEAGTAAPPADALLKRRPAFWTFDDEAARDGVGHLYYFGPVNRRPPPYLKQIEVNAIVDIADDGTLAGVELIDDMPPPPVSAPDASADRRAEDDR